MTLGDLLKQHLREPLSQKSVAMSWLERAPGSGQGRKPSTIESQLSRCFRDQRQGVRFFFVDRERARTLLDVMNVPEGDRAPIYAAAEELLKMDKDRPPLLIVDVTSRSGRVDARQLFEALRAAIIEPRPLEPALLFLTEVQYDDLPRSFDQHEDWLRVEIVAETEVPARLADPACAGALVASFRRHVPPDRWLAMDLDLKAVRLMFEPADGLERFARDGSLALPAVAHDLAGFMSGVPIPPFDPNGLGPLEQRRAMVDLGSEDRAVRVEADPAKRLAMARALEVIAVATPRDRIEAELREAEAELGTPNITSMPSAKFAELLARARKRPQPPTIVRVEDQLEVVNPDPDQPGLKHSRVRVHRIEVPEPALGRLRAAIERWTQGDFEADPFLHGMISRLDPGGREQLAFLHARALLLRQPLSPREGGLVEDWRAALMRLLVHDVPPAMLRLEHSSKEPSRYWTVAAPPLIEDALRGRSQRDVGVLKHPRPALASSVSIARDETAVLASELASYDTDKSAIRALDVAGGPRGTAGEQWLDAFEAWTEGRSATGPFFSALKIEPVGPFPWDEADLHLGFIWLALRAAIRSTPAIELHDGRVLLPIGEGLAVRVDVYETAERWDLRALLDVFNSSDYRHSGWMLSVGVASGIPSIKLEIPRRLILLGEQLRAEIEFIGSPLCFGAKARPAIVAAELARQADERAQAEASSWDDDD